MSEIITKAKARTKNAAHCAANYVAHREGRLAYQAAYDAARREDRAAYRAAHREERAAYNAAWRAVNSEKIRTRSAAWYAANSEKIRTHSAAWRAANPEKRRAADAAWRAANPEKRRAQQAKRRAMKLMQLCTCCTNDQIEEFHAQAVLYSGHVDHIIPLALGGKHCRHNLQAMTYEEHREKTKHDSRAITEAKRRSRLLRRWRLPQIPKQYQLGIIGVTS